MPTLLAPSTKMQRVDYYFQRSCSMRSIQDESREEEDIPLRHSLDPPGIPSPRNFLTTALDENRRETTPRILPRVSFDDSVSVRLYNTVLGDNPSVRNGPPVSLGWVYTPEKRPMAAQKQPRNHKHCYLDTPTRIERLRKNGVTVPEMEDAIAEVKNLQDLRKNNLNLIVRTKVPVVAESRKRPLSPRNSNKAEIPAGNTAFRTKKEGFLPVSNPNQRHPWGDNHHHFHHHQPQQFQHQHHHHQPSRPHYYYYAIGMRTPSPPRTSQQPFRLPAYHHVPRRPPLQPIQPPPAMW